MQRDLQARLRQLRATPLPEVRERIGQARHELENAQLAKLQQAFIRLPYSLAPSALILFDEISLSLQTFARQLLQHYVFESELLEEELGQPIDHTLDKPTFDRLRFEHQSLQESLSDLQSLACTFSDVARSPDVSRFYRLLTELAENLHEQILAEDKVLLPRCRRN